MSNSSFPSLTLKADGMCNAFAKSNVLIFTQWSPMGKEAL